MKRFLLAGAAFLLAAAAFAQIKEDFVSLASNQDGQEYPMANSEGYVRARIFAPKANEVQLQINGILFPMTKDEEGYWTGTSTQPFDEGNHYYALVIDGAEVPDPRACRPETPAPLAELIMRLMAKKPEDRFASASDLLDALARIEVSLFGKRPGGGVPDGTLFIEPDDRPGFVRELGALDATCRFENSLLELRYLEEDRRDPKRRLRRGALFLLALAAAVLLGGLSALRSAAAPEGAPPEIKRLDSVEEQWVFALQTDTAQSWESLLRFFPDDPFWTVKAEKRLASALVYEGRTKEASEIFDRFARGDAEGISGIPFGMAGQAWICAAEGDADRAASLLSELRKEGKSLDPLTEALISKATAIVRNQQ